MVIGNDPATVAQSSLRVLGHGALVLASLLCCCTAIAELPPSGAQGLPDGAAAALPDGEALARIRWIPRPCLDFLEHGRIEAERAASSGPLSTTDGEALALTNTSRSDNERILATLGRPPRSPDEVDWDATFNRYLPAEPGTLNPMFRTSFFDACLAELTAVQVVDADWSLEVYGNLDVIRRWEVSEDRLLERVTLRDDLFWTDGKPVTAHDVEFTYRTVLATRNPHQTMALGLRAVKAYDDHTLVYFQKAALATNHLHLSWPILPSHVYEPLLALDPTLEKHPDCVKANTQPVTCGPYRVVSWDRGQSLVLERRPEWSEDASGKLIRARPHFKTVRFKLLPQPSSALLAFKAGEVDDVELLSEQWLNETGDDAFRARGVKVRGDKWSNGYIGWNLRSQPPNPFFVDGRVRLAMGFAVDYDHVMDDIFHGLATPGTGLFHPRSPWAAPGLEPPRYDLDRAEQLLEEAGWTDSDADGVRDKLVGGARVPFEFDLSYPSQGQSGRRIAENLQLNLRKIGVRCHLKALEWSAFNDELRARRLQAFVMAMVTGADPDTTKNLWSTAALEESGGRNYCGFSNARVDELFEKGSHEFDPAARRKIYQEIERRIMAENPITPLCFLSAQWAFSRSLRGYRLSPRGFYTYGPGFFSLWRKKADGGPGR